MNAVKLYVSTARLILENDHYDQVVCKEICSSFPSLEQALSCTVCRNILREPYSPPDTACQHHVCKSCVGGRKSLKPFCSWCKDYNKYVKNTQLQCLLASYKALCTYVKYSSLLNQLNVLYSTADGRDKSILSIIQKGAQLVSSDSDIRVKQETEESRSSIYNNELVTDQRYQFLHRRNSSSPHQQNHYEDDPLRNNNITSRESKPVGISRIRIKRESRASLSPLPDDKSLMNVTEAKIATPHHSPRLRSASESTNPTVDKLSDSTSDELNPKTVYSVSFTGTKSKIILKRKHVSSRRDVRKDRKYMSRQSANHCEQLPTSQRSSSQRGSMINENNSRFRNSKPKPPSNTGRPNCRCGNATPKPGKLTCCGQRCACYMQSKACTGCRCRGCRNPHMIDGVKVLGRFAKDDSPESNLVMSNAPSFQDLSANFLNQQMNQVLPNMTSNGVMHIS